MREYNASHDIAPRTIDPDVLEELRVTSRAFGEELAGGAHPTTSHIIPQPAYSSLVRNMRAAEKIVGDLDNLEGEVLHQQELRIRKLLVAANR